MPADQGRVDCSAARAHSQSAVFTQAVVEWVYPKRLSLNEPVIALHMCDGVEQASRGGVLGVKRDPAAQGSGIYVLDPDGNRCSCPNWNIASNMPNSETSNQAPGRFWGSEARERACPTVTGVADRLAKTSKPTKLL